MSDNITQPTPEPTVSQPPVTPEAPVSSPVMEMPPAGGVPVVAPAVASTAHKSTLGVTLALGAVVLLLGLGSIYWFSSQSAIEDAPIAVSPVKSKSATKSTGTTAATPTATTTTTTTIDDTTISATPASSGIASTDIDSELKSLDAGLVTVKTTDFETSTLADTNLGL